MTIPKFGRVTPIQRDMLQLIGFQLSRGDVTLDISPYKRMEIMKVGRKRLQEQTGQDFGFDLSAWRDFLIANDSYGYTHPYGFSGVDGAVQEAMLDKKRDDIILTLETRGRELLERLLSSTWFPFDMSLVSIIPSTGGVYLISEVHSEQRVPVYLGQSRNMCSHIRGKHVKSIVRRRYERQNQHPGINEPKRVLRDSYRVQFISVDDAERDWFVRFAVEALRPLTYG